MATQIEGMVALAEGVNTLRYDRAWCIGCGMCAMVCPHGVFVVEEAPDAAATERASAIPVRPEACIECGACARNCPTGAIEVDAGVGCAVALIRAALTGGEPTCGPSCCGGGEEEACSCDADAEACSCGSEAKTAPCACAETETQSC